MEQSLSEAESCLVDAQLLDALTVELRDFHNSMRQLEDEAGEGTPACEAQDQVNTACDRLIYQLGTALLKRPDLVQQIQACVATEVSDWFKRSALANWAITKPMGYAGDFHVIDITYQNEPAGVDPIGVCIDRWCLSRPCAQAVRNRRVILKETFLNIAAEVQGPVAVTSLASGPARELFDLFAEPNPPQLFATCVDLDDRALAFTAETAQARRIADRFRLVQENVLLLSRGRSGEVRAPQNLIYSMGLIDYLGDKHVVRLLNWVYENLLPGGRVVIGNFGHCADRGFMECILQWPLILRSPDELRHLFAQSRFGEGRVEITSDSTGVQLLAMARLD